jgi:uncharacterized protein DUF5818
MKNHFVCRSLYVLTLSAASVGILGAQQPRPDTPPAAQSNQAQSSARATGNQQFTGMVVRQGQSLMLKDSYGVLTYKLDDQNKAQQYVGKRVKINGTLDSGRVLHVQSIEPGP